MKRVVIIGGGITGLAAAYRLLDRSLESGKRVDLTLLEAGNRSGGIVHKLASATAFCSKAVLTPSFLKNPRRSLW